MYSMSSYEPGEPSPAMIDAGVDALMSPDWVTPDSSAWFNSFQRNGSSEIDKVVIAIYQAMRSVSAGHAGN